MDSLKLSVQFTCNEDDGSYVFVFPWKERLQVPRKDIERSVPLRDMIESAATCEETTITFPSSVELSHFQTWAAAVQPGSPVFQANAEGIERSLVVCVITSCDADSVCSGVRNSANNCSSRH